MIRTRWTTRSGLGLIRKSGIRGRDRHRLPPTPCLERAAIFGAASGLLNSPMTRAGFTAWIRIAAHSSEMVIGAGTVLTKRRSLLEPGAEFITSPGLDLDIVEFAVRRNCSGDPRCSHPYRSHAVQKGRRRLRQSFPLRFSGRTQLYPRP